MTTARTPSNIDLVAQAARLLVRAYDELARTGGRLGSAGIEASDGAITLRMLPPSAVRESDPIVAEHAGTRYAVISLEASPSIEQQLMVMAALFPSTCLLATPALPVEGEVRSGARMLLDKAPAIAAVGEARSVSAMLSAQTA